MLIHIRYNDYVPEVEEMNNFEKNIETPSKEITEKYIDKVNNIINSLEKSYDIDSDGVHFVYANWKNEDENETVVKAFHPDNYDDWVQQPIVYIKTPKENWENSFEKEVSNAVKKEIFYDLEF